MFRNFTRLEKMGQRRRIIEKYVLYPLTFFCTRQWLWPSDDSHFKHAYIIRVEAFVVYCLSSLL